MTSANSAPSTNTKGFGGNLLYTMAFDPPGAGGTRQMVKMLAGSVMRTFFEGQMVIFRNSPQPLFLIQREGIAEMYVETPALEHQELANFSMAWKPRARAHIPQPEQYEWVVFLDSDCLMLRNIDHLLEEQAGVDILYQPEPGRYMTEGPFSAYLTADEWTVAAAQQKRHNTCCNRGPGGETVSFPRPAVCAMESIPALGRCGGIATAG